MIKTELRESLLIRALRGRGTVYSLRGNFERGIEDFREALSFCENLVHRKSSLVAEIVFELAERIERGRNEYDKAIELIKSGFRKITRKKEPTIYALGLSIIGIIYWRKGDYDKALKYYQKSLKIYKETKDKKGIGNVLTNIGVVFRSKGEINTALQYYKRCLGILEELGEERKISAVSNNIGSVYFYKGEFNTALRFYKRHLAISERIEYKMGIALAHSNIGIVCSYKGKLNTALKYCKRSLDLSEQIGDKRGIGMSSNNIAEIYSKKGEFNTALKYAKKHLAISREIGYKRGIGIACFNIGSTFGEMGQVYEAKKYLRKAENIFKDTEDRIHLPEVYAVLSEMNTKEGDYEKAKKFSKKALFLARKTKTVKNEFHSLCALGKALKEKNPEKAISCFKQSISIAVKEGINLDRGIALYELSRVLKDTGETKEAEKHLKTAGRIFRKSGAKLWLEKTKEEGSKE